MNRTLIALGAGMVMVGAIAGAGIAAAQGPGTETITTTADPRYPAGQTPVELSLTELLNRLSGQGFAQYRRIERVGDDYLVEVMTRDYQVVTLRVDARTGQITQAR